MQTVAELEDMAEYGSEEVGPVTTGEIYRRLIDLQATTQRSFQALDDRLTDNVVSKDFYQVRHESLMARVQSLETLAAQRSGYYRSLTVGVICAVLASAGGLIAAFVR